MFFCGGRYRVLRIVLMIVFCSFCFSYLKPVNTYSVASTINVSVVDNISLNITSTDSTGSFAHSDTTTPNISVKTTNASGYTLGIRANTSGANNNALINTSDNTKIIPSITISGGISEATYSSDPSYNNTWGYRPSKINSVVNSNYLPAPTSNTNAIILDATTASNPTTANTYNIAIGARINNATTSGSYTNVFVVTATANPIPYSIIYNANGGGDTVTNMPANVYNQTTYEDTVTLSSTIPSRAGYDFQGWCTIQVADNAVCTGTFYSAGSAWTIDQTTTTNTLTLYAMWQPLLMQNVSSWGNSIDIGQEVIAKDSRDQKTYTVARLCMSKTYNTCTSSMLWMTQNLDLEIGSTGLATLSSESTDINNNLGSSQGYSTSGSNIIWSPKNTMSTPKVITNYSPNNPANSTDWINDNSLPYWGEGGDYYVYTSGNNNTDTIFSSLTACTASHTVKECKHYHIGNYYNFSAATAVNAGSSYTQDLYAMPNSICPKDWRLPNGLLNNGGSVEISEFNQLALANGLTKGTTTSHSSGTTSFISTGWAVSNTSYANIRSTSMNSSGYAAPIYYSNAGALGDKTLYKFADRGFIWANTSQSLRLAYSVGYRYNEFIPAHQDVRYYGFSVRCVSTY